MISVEISGEDHARVTTAHGVIQVTTGHRYVIEPPNPRKTRNRGRQCEVVGIKSGTNGHYVDIRYLDNGRRGRAEFEELAPL